LNIPTFAMVDTNSDPTNIDFPIPSNDDATKSISLITEISGKAIQEGLEERKRDKEEEAEREAAAAKARIDNGEEATVVTEEAEASGKRPRTAKASTEATAEAGNAPDGE